MSPFDIVAFVGAVITGLTVFARAELLGPRVRSSYATNPVVRLLMDAVALTCAFVAFELWGGASVPDAVAWFFVLSAITSTAMLVSMFVHDGRVALTEVKAADVVEMRDAVAEVVPPVVERSLEKLTEGFMKPAPDHDRLIRVEPLPSTPTENEPGSPA